MATKIFKVINKLTGCIVFIGTKQECTSIVMSDKTGFLDLYI